MVKEITLPELLSIPSEHIEYYASTIEAMKKPNVEWPHRQSFYSVLWFVQGKGFNVIDFRKYKIQQGRMFLVNPDQINNWVYTNDCKGYILLFAKPLASQLGIEFSKPYIDIGKRDASLLQLVFKNLIKNCKLDSDDSRSKVMTSIQYFYSLIADKTHDKAVLKKGINHIVWQFKELVLSRATKVQSMDEYAAALHISTATLNTICQSCKGISAKQLLIDLKMTEAKRLMLYSDLTVSEISFQLGFEDSSYFTRIFRKKTTLSPTQFREKYRK